VLDRAVELTQKHRLRGYDAVQLASALVAGEVMRVSGLPLPVFIASDSSLLMAATAERVPVDNPLDHP
jgi:hypothetical protein